MTTELTVTLTHPRPETIWNEKKYLKKLLTFEVGWFSRSIKAALLQMSNEATINNCENCNENCTIRF